MSFSLLSSLKTTCVRGLHTLLTILRQSSYNTVKIPKISPGAYIFQRPLLRGLSTEGNLYFKID